MWLPILISLSSPFAGPASTSTTAPSLPPLEVGTPVPRFRLPISLPASAEGQEEILDLRAWFDQKTHRRVVVTFGASWCAPCKQELAALNAGRAQLEAQGIQLVVIVADQDEEGRAKMLEWLQALGAPFPVIVDDFGMLTRRYRAAHLPAVYVADASGTLLAVRSGFETDDVVGELLTVAR